MEPIRKPNGKDLSPYDQDLPNDGTKVEQSREITDMPPRPLPDGLSTEDFNSAMLKLAVQGREDTDKIVGAIQATNGKSKGPVMMSVAAIVFTAGGLVASFTMKTSTAAQDHEEVIRMKVLAEADSKKLDALDEYLRDIREDLAAHGLLNKGGSNANSRK